MKEFTDEIVSILNREFSSNKEFIQGITLATYGFNIQFYNFEVQCEETVYASIGNIEYKWTDSPSNSPWGSLVSQIPISAELQSPLMLKIIFESGDTLIITTTVGNYESVIFTFPPENEAHVMEIF